MKNLHGLLLWGGSLGDPSRRRFQKFTTVVKVCNRSQSGGRKGGVQDETKRGTWGGDCCYSHHRESPNAMRSSSELSEERSGEETRVGVKFDKTA